MISEDDVRHVARLARLYLSPDEVARMTGELAKILDHIDKMRELELGEVAPTAHVLEVVNVYRADKTRPSWRPSAVLKNAPAVSDECFRVPKMG